MANGLYRADGTFQPFDYGTLSTEIATRQNAGITFGTLESWLNVLPDPDPILRKRGDDAAVLADLTADDQVTTAILSRKNRVLNCRDFSLRPGAPDGKDPTPEATRLYDRFVQDLERTNMRDLISGILDAPFYGFVPLELVWRRGGDWWHLVDIVVRPYRWIAFDTANNPVFVGEYGSLCASPLELPAGKFVLARHHATYDNPYGLRLLSRCLWPVSFKRGGMSFYARFIERHGMPWVVGEAPAQAEKAEKERMARNLARMVQDAVAVVPHGANVKLEAAGQTQGALHENFLSRMDKAISKLLMGQTLTVEMEGKNSQAAAQTHQDVAESLADADKAMVADAFNEIAWLYAQVNAGPGVLAPLASYEEPEDLNERADLDKKLVDIGVRFKAEHFTENYGLKESEFTVAVAVATQEATDSDSRADEGEAAPQPSGEVPPEGAADFAAPGAKSHPAEKAQATLDAAIVKMLPKALKASEGFVKEVEKAVHAAKSYDDLQDALVELLAPSLTPGGLEEFIACAMTAAAGHGATAVAVEAQDA